MSDSADEMIYEGRVFNGVKTVRYDFQAPEQPGTYFFRCDVHPVAMVGDFIVTSDM